MNNLLKRALERCVANEQRRIDEDRSGAGEKYHKNRIQAMRKLAEEVDSMTEKKVVYVCSPLSGDYTGNQERAKAYCSYVLQKGSIPYAPHLFFTQFLDDRNPAERSQGCAMGLTMLEQCCDELWVFGDVISPGMKQEILFCERFGIPVFYVERGEV